jgi:hypothetical protein
MDAGLREDGREVGDGRLGQDGVRQQGVRAVAVGGGEPGQDVAGGQDDRLALLVEVPEPVGVLLVRGEQRAQGRSGAGEAGKAGGVGEFGGVEVPAAAVQQGRTGGACPVSSGL